MAFLEKGAFEITIDLEGAKKKVESLLKKRHWKEFSFIVKEHGLEDFS